MTEEAVSADAARGAALALLTLFLKKPAERIGEIVSDRMSYWQLCNWIAIAERTQKKLHNKGLSVESLPAKFRELVPIIEAARNEDDPTLQNMWSGLLSSELDPNTKPQVFNYSAVLRLLSPTEAKVLSLLAQSVVDANQRHRRTHIALSIFANQKQVLSELCEVDQSVISLAFAHLDQLGLVLTPDSVLREVKDLMTQTTTRIHTVWYSAIGTDFMFRCTDGADFLGKFKETGFDPTR